MVSSSMLFSAFFKAITLVDAKPGSGRCGEGICHKGSDENIGTRRAGGFSRLPISLHSIGRFRRTWGSSPLDVLMNISEFEAPAVLLTLKVLMNL